MTPPHRVAALCLGRVVAFDLGVASEAFTETFDRQGRPLYDFRACTVDGRRIESTTGFAIDAVGGLEDVERADTVIVPGYREIFDSPPPEALAALWAVFDRGCRVVSICTGAYALGHAGLLDGRRATTHWFFAPRLAEMFPSATVEPNALYIDEGRILTSAGLSAGIDLCLHIVRRDHGEDVGAALARIMVASPHRDGGQAQFIARPIANGSGSLDEARRWALENLGRQVDVITWARQASVSPRTFARRFFAETGTTPLRWLQSQRVLEARRLLESTDLPVEDVATRAGFGSAPSLREHFRRATETTPTAYRRTFRT
jgi:AraC family transcriptional activator FtrA